MNKIIKITDGFLKNHKNKIMLASIGVILIGFLSYFAGSADKVYMKVYVVFLSSGAFLSAFYLIKALIYIRNKLMKANKTAGYVFDMLCLILAAFMFFAEVYDFILTACSDGFVLIICAVIAALFNAVVFSR